MKQGFAMLRSMFPNKSHSGKSSGLGIASFVLGVLSYLILIIYSGFVRYWRGNITAVGKMSIIGPGLTAFILILVFIGLLFGFVSLLEKQKERFLGFLGIILNMFFLLGIITLSIINLVNYL
jgi:hypothetical protein